jgi:hypothetical protein
MGTISSPLRPLRVKSVGTLNPLSQKPGQTWTSPHWTLTLSIGSTNLACTSRIYTMGILFTTLYPLCPKQTRITRSSWQTGSTCVMAVLMRPPTPLSTCALSQTHLPLPYPSSQSQLSISGMRGTYMMTGLWPVLLCLMTPNCKQLQMASVKHTMLV